jgi:hypothetical protein
MKEVTWHVPTMGQMRFNSCLAAYVNKRGVWFASNIGPIVLRSYTARLWRSKNGEKRPKIYVATNYPMAWIGMDHFTYYVLFVCLFNFAVRISDYMSSSCRMINEQWSAVWVKVVFWLEIISQNFPPTVWVRMLGPPVMRRARYVPNTGQSRYHQTKQ